MCWYCGCHTKVCRRDEPIKEYLKALHEEMAQIESSIGRKQTIGHLHFGGGTPTIISPSDFLALMEKIHQSFTLSSSSEIAIEVDPRSLTPRKVSALAEGGVTRASLGVQSFDPAVQRAINRIQTPFQTHWAVDAIRKAGVNQINFDLIYGLPEQTTLSVR